MSESAIMALEQMSLNGSADVGMDILPTVAVELLDQRLIEYAKYSEYTKNRVVLTNKGARVIT